MTMEDKDPWVMYLIVNESLNMSTGKACAQTSHATEYLVEQYYKIDRQIENMFTGCDPQKIMDVKVPPELALKCDAFVSWRKAAHRKVVLKANQNKFDELLNSDLDKVIVIDAGYTEVEPGTITVIGVWPMKKSTAPKIIRGLQLLK